MAAEERSIAGKTRRFELRLSDDDRERFQAMADSAGITLSELIRRRLHGAKVVPRRDTTKLLNEIRRQGGLLKYLHIRGEPVLDTAQQVASTAERIEAFIMALDDPASRGTEP
jgi:uncharacterized protein (DUF1778 family)